MLKSIRLENFKLHEKTEIDAARITVFIGPNNSGKSSIFQALLALRQAAARGTGTFLAPSWRLDTSATQPFLFRSTDLIDIGEFKDVVRHGRDEVKIGLSGIVEAPLPIEELGSIQLSFQVGLQDNTLTQHEGELRLSHGAISWKHLARAMGLFPQPSIRIFNSVLKFDTVSHFQLIQFAGQDMPPGVTADAVNRFIQTGQLLAATPVRLLTSLQPIYALRGFEEWACPLPDQPTGTLEGLVLADRAVAIASTLAADSKLRRQVSERLQDLLNIGIDIEAVGKRIKIYATSVRANGSETLFANEGTGANQLPFILLPIALAKPSQTVLLQEPEAHLHPKRQSELTSVLLTIAEKQNLQLFIETHSEHVLHKLLNAVAKGQLRREDLAIYYFEPKEGRSEAKHLEVDATGGVKGGLPGFFDQSLNELSEYLEALKEPKG